MATLIANASTTQLMSGAATFAAAEAGALAAVLNRNSLTTIAAATTVTSVTFTVTNAKVIDAVLLWLKSSAAGPTGTIKVDLQKGGVSQASVTVDKADLPVGGSIVVADMVPVLFKLTTTATGDGGSNWTIVITTTGTGTVTIARASATTNNYTRALRTTTAATLAAGDDFYVVGELTGQGTNTARTVTMDSVAATVYGNGAVNSITVSGGLCAVSCHGTLSYQGSAATNYILRLAGDLIVAQFGTLNIGATGAEIPRNSTAVLEFQPVSADGDFGLRILDNATCNIAGLSRTSGKNIVKCKLTADVVSANVLTGLVSTGMTSVASTGLEASGNSALAVFMVENSSNTAHSHGAGGGSASNQTQTATVWLARGTGANNRYVRFLIGNSAVSSSVANGFYSDIDLQAGTAGTVTAMGNGTATSVSITAVGDGYLIRMTGIVTSGAGGTSYAHVMCCSAAGTTVYAGSGASTVRYDRLSLITAASISDTTFNVDEDTGWLAGDAICVASTTRTASECEIYPLNANAGSSSLVSSLYPFSGTVASTHHGTAPTQAEIALITRNVKIRSTSMTLVTFVYVAALATIDFSWAEFVCGTNVTGKRGLEINAGAVAGVKNIEYCSFHDGENAGVYLSAGSTSLNLTMSNNIFWNTGTLGLHLVGTVTNADWIMDGNLVMRPGSTGFNLGDLSGTFTNNTAVGAATVQYGIQFNTSGDGIYPVGTFTNNTAHSCNSAGLLISSNLPIGVLDGFTIWRNGNYGIQLAASCVYTELVFINFLMFGNSAAGIYFNNDVLNIKDSIICGDTLFNTLSGVYTQQTMAQQFKLDNVDFTGDTSAHASVLVPIATQIFNFVMSSTRAEVQATLRNCLFDTTTLIDGTDGGKPGWSTESYMNFQKFNQTAGDHRTEMKYGQLKTDTAIYNTAAPSMRMTPNNASSKLESASKHRGITVPVANGSTVDITVYVRKSEAGDGAAYNGNQPRLIQRANPALGQSDDVVLDTVSVAVGNWEQLSATSSSATDDGAWEFIVDCDGTTGWVNVDDWEAFI